MATLKVYSREYGVKKVEEKVTLTRPELFVYIALPLVIIISLYFMLSYSGKVYSLQNQEIKNTAEIKKMKNDTEEQRVIINDLSSYERIRGVAEILGMEPQKDNVKVVR
ncbi:cell division protein FtsL [Gemella sp. GH3]|uniref:cell division protein FtsL n=1 Tax=unclassified Gemella TaxID=2624949 RepID=UPI0015D08A77|nr:MULTISPECIES: cell division protein FtsL [unclassified Gemella]MBF0714292.1 cell division protein FtsL [Gemella sp. GH3.1]NYS51244.1 cell division protein FtsL [Gemella sp. GH3]